MFVGQKYSQKCGQTTVNNAHIWISLTQRSDHPYLKRLSYNFREFPGGPAVRTLLLLQGVWVHSLVGEPRS